MRTFKKILALALCLFLLFSYFPCRAEPAESFDGRSLYSEAFQAIRENHIALSDKTTSAAWSKTWNPELVEAASLSDEKTTDALIAKMLASLKGRFDSYLKPLQSEGLSTEMDPKMVGIGVGLGVPGQAGEAEDITIGEELPLTILKVFSGSPADLAGLLPGDRIIAINKKTTSGLSLNEAITSLSGPEGSLVAIRISRHAASGWRTIDLELTRKSFIPPVVYSATINGDIRYIALLSFTSRYASDEMLSALEQSNQARSVIIDLRDNPGGLLTNAEIIAQMLLENGDFITFEARDGDHIKKVHYILLPDRIAVEISDLASGELESVVFLNRLQKRILDEKIPVMVLINERSASASEILAGILQANHRATLIGTHSFGKSVGQVVIPLPSGRTILITSFRFRPGGLEMPEGGLKPDIEVRADDSSSIDTQFQTAIDQLETSAAVQTMSTLPVP